MASMGLTTLVVALAWVAGSRRADRGTNNTNNNTDHFITHHQVMDPIRCQLLRVFITHPLPESGIRLVQAVEFPVSNLHWVMESF